MNSSPPPTPPPCMFKILSQSRKNRQHDLPLHKIINSIKRNAGKCLSVKVSVKVVCVCFCRYLQADPEHFDLQDLKCKFDVILLEPPLEEYYRESGISHTERFWTWDDVCTHFLINTLCCYAKKCRILL